MNIHEYQAKELLKKFGVPIPKGVVAFSVEEVLEKAKLLKINKYVLKAQIHAGGRGKAGGIKILDNLDDLKKESSNLFGKFLKTHQTGPKGKEIKRLYIEEATEIDKEFYLSCLVDRASSKIAFISSAQGGMDIEEVALKNPNNVITYKLDYKDKISDEEAEKVISIFNLKNSTKNQTRKIVQSIYQAFIKTDASLIEINPLVITKKGNVLCLDAKINFDDNGLYKHPEILKLRDLNEEEPAEIEASKYNLSYIKLNGKIGCMVNGAGLAMATMDIIKLNGEEPANFLDVGGGASKEKVAAAFKIILSDKAVKGI
jgi:succinyl-CoA synthetase beta subunit